MGRDRYHQRLRINGAILKDARKKRGWTQQKLTEEVKRTIGLGNIQYAEMGSASMEIVDFLCAQLDIGKTIVLEQDEIADPKKNFLGDDRLLRVRSGVQLIDKIQEADDLHFSYEIEPNRNSIESLLSITSIIQRRCDSFVSLGDENEERPYIFYSQPMSDQAALNDAIEDL
jgi:transcriptional regulator with XRE-family HTH domain